MPPFDVSLEAVSENAVLLAWQEKICPEQHRHIMACRDAIHRQFSSLVIDTVAGYNSLMLYYHFQLTDPDTLLSRLKQLIREVPAQGAEKDTQPVLEIPVCYDEKAGWDLTRVAKQTSLSREQVIALHQEPGYRAYALGFTPGFCYLGSLAPQLQLSRRSNPRASVPKGAVAIAGMQTAVYPNASPGGWHILGQTPLAMYSVKEQSFEPLITPGRQIRFYAIDAETFKAMAGEPVAEEGEGK